MSPLRTLSQIISKYVDAMEENLEREGASFPSLDQPLDPSVPSEIILGKPEMLEAASHIVAAASQLIASVRHPTMTVLDHALSFHVSSCLRAVIECNIVEIVKEAGPQGVHVDEISKKNGTDAPKVARILRLLSTNHIFREVAPDVFAFNRLASAIDSRQSTVQLAEKPAEKYNNAPLAAMIVTSCDEVMKGSAYMTEALLDSSMSHAVAPDRTPWNMAFQTSLSLFDWYNHEENRTRSRRFDAAMATADIGISAENGPLLAGFSWKSLPEDALIVDVGGGIGAASRILAQVAPRAKFVIQDRASTIEEAKEYWKKWLPDAIESGRVALQAHDFFEPQPVREAAVFFLRNILHDWSDPFAQKILERLRAAAAPSTKLIISERHVPYSCSTPADGLPGSTVAEAPAPLLPNFGKMCNLIYEIDLQMYILFNGQDRTTPHLAKLAAACGWKIERVYSNVRYLQCVFIPTEESK